MDDPTTDAKASIRALLEGASLETSVKDLTEIDGYPGLLPAGSDVYVTWLPSFPYRHLVSVSARIAHAGYRPVPHLAARRIADSAIAEDLLARLNGEAGVDKALVIAGDIDRPSGPYEDAAALLASGVLERHGIRSVGLAAYPEGHPKISDARLADALREKLRLAADAGLSPYIASQFAFEGGAIRRWMAQLAAEGIRVPLRVGLAGPASVRTLINFGLRCGVGASLRAVKSHGISLTRLLAEAGPENVIADLAVASLPLSDVRLHFFSFGGFERTARWLRAYAGNQ